MSKLIKISKVYKELGVCRKTLYNWMYKGKLSFIKSPGGHNFIDEDTYNTLLNINKNNSEENEKEKRQI